VTSTKTPGSRIAHSLDELGLSKSEAARKLGLSSSYMSHLTNGRKYPSTRVILQLEEQLNIPRLWVEKGVPPAVAITNSVRRELLETEPEIVELSDLLDRVQVKVDALMSRAASGKFASHRLHQMLDQVIMVMGSDGEARVQGYLEGLLSSEGFIDSLEQVEPDEPTERA